MQHITYKRIRFILWLFITPILLVMAPFCALLLSSDWNEFRKQLRDFIPEWPRRVLKDFPF